MFLKKTIILICVTVMKTSIMTHWNKLKPMKTVTSSSPQTRCSTSVFGGFIEHKRETNAGSTSSECWKVGSFYPGGGGFTVRSLEL